MPLEKPPDYEGILPHWDAIADPTKPELEGYVVATGGQLHRLLKDQRGYNLILVRDCTTGIENSYTIDDFSVTKFSVMQTSDDFINACKSLLN